MRSHSEEVGAAFGLLADGCWRVGGLRDVDTKLLLAGAWRGRHRRGVVAQTAAAVTRLYQTTTNRQHVSEKSDKYIWVCAQDEG